MIFELRTYTVQPGSQAEYLRLSGEVGRKIRGDNYGHQEGFWTTEFGPLNQLVHLWSYADLGERDRLRKELARNEAWTRDYIPRTRPLLVAQENKILSAVLPIRPPDGTGHVYELRTYRAHVGKLAEWLALFQGVLPVREKYSKPVGLWQTEISQLNEVVHLWAYRDLNHRRDVRAQVAADPEWQALASEAAPLLAEMRSVILNPTSWSKLG